MFSGLLNSLGLANAAQGQYNQGIMNSTATNNQLSAQALAYNQAMMAAQLNQHRHEWMINGRSMTFNQFVEEICPDPDDPMRTYLILKYKDTK